MKEIVKVENLIKKYKETTAVNNISFTVNKGEFVAIVGASRKWKVYIITSNWWS